MERNVKHPMSNTFLFLLIKIAPAQYKYIRAGAFTGRYFQKLLLSRGVPAENWKGICPTVTLKNAILLSHASQLSPPARTLSQQKRIVDVIKRTIYI